jgi:threonine/homoserine/homoserine lactone efflux protein
MSQQLTIAFVLFAVACCFTPGPNNAMLLTSGLNHGFRRTLPHVLGVTFGYGFLVAVMGLGFGAIFSAYPTLYMVLKYVGAAYLLYLAWAIAMSGGIDDRGEKRGRPMTFLGGAVYNGSTSRG